MNKLFILWVSLLWGSVLFGQKISNIDFDEVKRLTQDSLSDYYYPVLTKRFLELDAHLSAKEYSLIYYGSVFSKNYNPYGKSTAENQFLDVYKEKKYSEAIEIGVKVLEENPANLAVVYKIYAAYFLSNDKNTAKLYAEAYLSLLNAIYMSGDGKSFKTAYVVVGINDEYEILADLGLTITKQALVGNTDVLSIKTKGQKKQKGQKKIKELYFNVEMPFKQLMNQVKKTDE